MRTIVLRLMLAMLASLLPAVAAPAQMARTFVSAQGVDSNPCSLAAPCRSFAAAVMQTSAGGEIDVLNTAGYGSVTITKAISIVAQGVNAGVQSNPGSAAITISAGPNDAISLQGLDIEGQGSGTAGIQFTSGQSLSIQNCAVRDFTNTGIYFAPGGSSNLFVSETLVINSGNYGILIQPTGSGLVKGVLNRVSANQNGVSSSGYGIYVSGASSTGALNVTVADSVAAGNFTGIAAGSMSAGSSAVMVRNSTSSNNTVGISASSATVLVGQSTISGNTLGWQAVSSGVLSSYANNNVNGNTTNGTSSGAISLQ